MNKLCKPLCSVLLVFCLLCAGFSHYETEADELWPAAPEVNASSAIVIEADTGAVLYEKEIHTQHYPASITKIMTTLLALENTSLSDIVTFSYDSVHKIEGTHIGLTEGEQLTMDQCLHAVMMASANEAAYAVAEHTGGTLDNFIRMMNERAVELGCTETHFNNPHGLPDETHLTSAHDMALIAQAAYSNPTFREITKTLSYTIPATNKTAETRPISNHHKMLKQGIYKYEYCTGGKTGYTNAARYTLVTFAEKDGMSLICVVMQCDTSEDEYQDTARLLDYGFNNFHKISVSGQELGLQLDSEGFFPIRHNPLSADNGKVTFSSDVQLVMPNLSQITDVTSSVTFTDKTSGEIADVTCSLEGHYLGKTAINYTPGKNSSKKVTTDSSKETTTDKPFPTKKVLLIIFIVLCLLGFIAVILFAIRNGLFEIERKTRKQKVHSGKNVRKRSSIPRHQSERNSKEPVRRQSFGSSHTPRLHSEFEQNITSLDDEKND